LKVKDPAQAGVFKASLDRVSKEGDKAFKAFMAETEAWVTGIVKQADSLAMTLPPAAGVPCPKCSTGRLRRIEGKNGWFWSCSRWNAEPKCSATFPDKRGKPDLAPPAPPTPEKIHPCPSCSGQLRRKKGPSGFFWGCSSYPTCKNTLPDEKGAPGKPRAAEHIIVSVHACPKCRKNLRKLTAKKGLNAGKEFWACSGWPTCDFSASDLKGVPGL
jgi:DNA topoisomerase-3